MTNTSSGEDKRRYDDDEDELTSEDNDAKLDAKCVDKIYKEIQDSS